jgi:hypothetical protein
LPFGAVPTEFVNQSEDGQHTIHIVVGVFSDAGVVKRWLA